MHVLVHNSVGGVFMNLIRINDKVINKGKIFSDVDRILEQRAQGFSQQDVAKEMGLERSFISRLEGLGEIRKGGTIAVVGFPIKNIDELQKVLNKKGIEYSILMTEEERWRFIKEKSGLELFNKIMEIIQQVRSFDKVILLGSKQRVKMLTALFDKEIFTIELGESPLSEDIYVDTEQLENIIDMLSVLRGERNETCYQC